MITLKISKKKIEELKNKYSLEKKINQNYFYFYKKINNLTISIFLTGTLNLQGNEKEITIFLNKEKLNTENKKYFEHIGGDESGIGDYFGPIVLTLFKYTKNLKNLDIFNKIKDSKKLNNNSIKIIAKKLIKLKNHFKIYIISNEELNESHKNNINSKEILAIHYSKLLNDKIFNSNKIIIDGFTTKTVFNKYCIKNNIKIKKLELISKAENQFLGVAAASIISRFYFLEEIEKIEKILNLKIKLGANSEVKKQVKKILQTKKYEKDIKKYIKLFFKY